MKGAMLTPQFIFYMLMVLDSFYIQEEIDDLKKLFKKEDD